MTVIMAKPNGTYASQRSAKAAASAHIKKHFAGQRHVVLFKLKKGGWGWCLLGSAAAADVANGEYDAFKGPGTGLPIDVQSISAHILP